MGGLLSREQKSYSGKENGWEAEGAFVSEEALDPTDEEQEEDEEGKEEEDKDEDDDREDDSGGSVRVVLLKEDPEDDRDDDEGDGKVCAYDEDENAEELP